MMNGGAGHLIGAVLCCAGACLFAQAPYGGGGWGAGPTPGGGHATGRPGPQAGYRSSPGGAYVHSEHPMENSLRRPWAGSVAYERKKAEAEAKSVYHRARQDVRVQQDNINYEIERQRARERADAREAERAADLREAKAEVRQRRYDAESDRREILEENRDTIRRRANEQERKRGW